MLTRTQLDALAHLHKTGRQWPTGRGRGSVPYDGVHARFSLRTLAPLIEAGLARPERDTPGVMPHIVPTLKVRDGIMAGAPSARVATIPASDDGAAQRAVARAVLTGDLWARYPQAYIDGDRVSRVVLIYSDLDRDYYTEAGAGREVPA